MKGPAPARVTGNAPGERGDNQGFEVQESDAERFLIVVESTPAGARVHINDIDQRLTPTSSTLECESGNPVRVAVSRPGYRPARYATTCRAKKLLQLYAPLKKLRSGS